MPVVLLAPALLQAPTACVDPAALQAHLRDVNVAGDLVPGDHRVEVVVPGSFGVASGVTRLRGVRAP